MKGFEMFARTGIPDSSFAVSPSDTTEYTDGPAMGFMVTSVAGGAIVKVVHKTGDTPVDWPVAVGVQYACKHVRIHSTGTTATGIIAFR